MGINFKFYSFDELSTQQLYDALELRQVVFTLEQNSVWVDLDNKDQDSMHLLGFDKNNKLVAYGRVSPSGVCGENISLNRIVVRKSDRGSGLGQEVMKHLLSHVAENYPSDSIEIEAIHYLKKFYEKFGFSAISEKHKGAADWYYYDMIKKPE
ncbi:MAG: GNAT family N-acetyltransferase [Alphaproteobacteria bacterium]|nr:GNAT family N-acetyltransferase [Alphaproteobacteria bacterium]